MQVPLPLRLQLPPAVHEQLVPLQVAGVGVGLVVDDDPQARASVVTKAKNKHESRIMGDLRRSWCPPESPWSQDSAAPCTY